MVLNWEGGREEYLYGFCVLGDKELMGKVATKLWYISKWGVMNEPTMEQDSLQQCWMATNIALKVVSDLHRPIAWIWDGGTPAAAKDVAPPARIEWPPMERGKTLCNLDKNQKWEDTEPSEQSHNWGNRAKWESQDTRYLWNSANGSEAVVLFWMITWLPSNITSVLDWGIEKKKKVKSRWTSCLHEIFEVERREEVSGCTSSPKRSKPKKPTQSMVRNSRLSWESGLGRWS